MKKKNLDDLEKTGKRGDWCFADVFSEQIAIQYGDDPFKDMVIIPISTNPDPKKREWLWDGNKEAPTLSPSIVVKYYEGWTDGWHGWLRNGVLVDA